MFVLLSGEGPTDMGAAAPSAGDAPVLAGRDFLPGPMALVVTGLVKRSHPAFNPSGGCGFVPKSALAKRSKDLPASPKSIRIPGSKRPKETRYFFDNARVLGAIARDESGKHEGDVIAVLFRDTDGSASASRGEWGLKRQSMIDGFEAAGFEHGVPMIPKPKSEAWLICALKPTPYASCAALENRSGNDHSPKSLKSELEALLGEPATREVLNSLVEGGRVDPARIDMPSFLAFRDRLISVLENPRP